MIRRYLFVAYLLGGAAVLAGLGGAYLAWRHHERLIGYQSALDQVAKQDAHAKAIAGQAQADVDACERGGGSFDVSTGDCTR
jgi:hypothetical protein